MPVEVRVAGIVSIFAVVAILVVAVAAVGAARYCQCWQQRGIVDTLSFRCAVACTSALRCTTNAPPPTLFAVGLTLEPIVRE